MSLNFDKIGKVLCKIVGGKLNNKVISVATTPEEEEKITREFKHLILPANCHFQQIPDHNVERQILYVTGQSGSGKTYYTSKYAQQYRKTFKTNPIYVFSALTDDDKLDDLEVKRIKIGENLLKDQLTASDFKNCLVIFDDIDAINKGDLKDEVYNILNQILQTGRHFNTSVIITNHLPTNGTNTKHAVNEASSITYFPHSGSAGKIRYLLTEHVGVDKKDIMLAKRTKSRWATIFKNYPMIMMTERYIKILGTDEQ